MWILEQIWKRNYFTCLENFYFFLNKAIDFQTNEVWSVVITSHRQCQKLPCFRKYCSLQGGAVLCLTVSHDYYSYSRLLWRSTENHSGATHGVIEKVLPGIATHYGWKWIAYFLFLWGSNFSGDHLSLRILVYFPQSTYYMIPQLGSNYI